MGINQELEELKKQSDADQAKIEELEKQKAELEEQKEEGEEQAGEADEKLNKSSGGLFG